jgi:UDPglucose 6-dehydrogenase
MKSTVPVGTGEKVRAGLDERGLDHVGYVSNPEFLAEGNAVRDFMEPDRIVIGAFEEATATRSRPLRVDRRADRALRRELGRDDQARRERVPDDPHLVHQRDRERLRGDRRRRRQGGGGHRARPSARPHFLRAGIGYGGSCFPKDSLALKQLASNSGYHFQLLSAVIEVNELQKRRVIGKLKRHLGSLRGKRSRCSGSRSSRDTDDMREAPSIVLAARLLAEGATVRAWDPVADGTKLPRASRSSTRCSRRSAWRRRGGDRDRVG